MSKDSCLAGIFVGGQAKRLTGTPKGLLQPPGSSSTLVERLVDSLGGAGIADIVLVGKNDAYDHMGLQVIPDSERGRGPMAGLLGLVDYATSRESEMVLAIACDMPFVDTALLRRLCSESPDADALVPKREQWEPLCARYRARAMLPLLRQLLESGQYRLTGLLDALGQRSVELRINPTEAKALEDWDCPSDLPEGVTIAGSPYDGRPR